MAEDKRGTVESPGKAKTDSRPIAGSHEQAEQIRHRHEAEAKKHAESGTKTGQPSGSKSR